MNIVSVEGDAFLTLGEFSVSLKDRGLLLIQGENDDDPSADSNGAGKSSLPDAISWALYGTTARGITGDAVINRKIGKGTFVEVFLEDKDAFYRVRRSRSPNSLAVTQFARSTVSTAGSDLTKGTQAETQEVINKIMGCSLEVFNAAVYAGQDAMPDLPGMTDKQLKLLIEEAAGVLILADAFNIARERVGDTERRLLEAKSAVVNLTDKRATMEANLKTYRAHKASLEDERTRETTELKAKASALLSQTAALSEWLHKAENVAELTGKIDGFETTAKAEKTKLAEQRRIAKIQLDDAKGLFQSIAKDTEKARQAVEAAKVELAGLSKRVGEPCLACGKPVLEEDLAGLKEMVTAKLKQAQERLDGINSDDLEAASKARAKAQEVVDQLEKKLEDSVCGVMVEYNELVSRRELYATKAFEKKALMEKAKALVDEANIKLHKPNPYDLLVSETEKQMAAVVIDLTHEVALAAGLETEHSLCLEAAKVFGQAGVRAHILDTVTPFLNARTSEYLGVMTDGNIHAVWNTLQKTAKGELRERFNIEVTNDKGAESFAGMSGGEKRKVRLATTMALQDMVASRAEKPLNIFIADEIDNALDESGLERLMTVLEQKARERGTVLIISHNSLSDWCDQIITVTKRAGISTLEES